MQIKSVLVLLILVLAGCATPPEVKQLSVQQNSYFDAAIKAVTIQSEALILATEKLVAQAQQRITDEEKSSQKVFEDLMQQGALSASDAQGTITSLAATAKAAEQSRAQLNQDLAAIKQKSNELIAFLSKMKQVNITLDSYIQSEKAGEAVVNDIMKQPSVSALLDTINSLTPKILSGATEINTLLNGIN
ncbi:hypothetical protein [Aliiglaciecola sp. LCG003]|uniref:hypothetical protein n=1 Tax=Aliiglaciecola sp. LCG003 TaxID=3053655 RepID=UPI00257388AD|nr:hypothetical protein [Aliiglaciecola sp. LCG003]WJG10691.1 hypothetical protein QR722_06520 [Aliiglaciecola sp. LCG003]